MHESVTYRISGNEESYSSCKVYTRTKIMIYCTRRSHGKYRCQQPR